MDEEAKLLTDTFTSCKQLMETLFCSTLQNPKNAKTSEDARKEGNVVFSKKSHSHESHAETLRSYNKSAALAPNGSQELAFVYANRSAFLLHIGKYEECIQDIDRALEMNKSDELKIKLLCRKVECLKNLGILSYENILEEAQSFVSKLDSTKNKNSLEEMVNKVATMPIIAKTAKDSNQKSNKTINLPVTDDVLKKVSIKYNEKYGRYLVANQNYSPGDIILVEKLFSTTLKPEFHYINCHHCLKICWTGIPCNHCEWALFCSEDCKLRAWQEYHDMECSLGSFYNMHNVFGIPWYCTPCSNVVGIFIKAIKAAGSIENLKAQLEAVDQCTDTRSKGFYKDGKFNSNTLESFYSLSKRKYIMPEVPEEITVFLQCILRVLIGLVKYPLKNIFQMKEAKDMMQNKEIVFLGSLLLKFSAIHLNNSFSFYHYLGHHEVALGIPQDFRGNCVSLLASLLNNSCCANAEMCLTEDGRLILYAWQSIKKNDQIFYSYSRQYSTRPLKDRKEDLKKYSFECDCQACVEAWPPVLLDKYEMLRDRSNPNLFAEAKLVQQCNSIWVPIEKDNYQELAMKLITPKIVQAFKTLKQPSAFTCMIQEVVGKCITNTYGCLKPQFYGECKMLDSESKRITHAYYGSGPRN